MNKPKLLLLLFIALACSTDEITNEATEKEKSWFEKFDNQLWVAENNPTNCSTSCYQGYLFKSNKKIILYDYWENDFESLCYEIIYTNFVEGENQINFTAENELLGKMSFKFSESKMIVSIRDEVTFNLVIPNYSLTCVVDN